MSQTETLMLFVLGFCVALLLVLLFGRSVWALIGGWSGWRQKRALPKTILDLQAERDSLKAEKAMLATRVERASTDLKMRLAEQMAEAARNRNRLLDLTASLKAAQAETAGLKAANSDLQGHIDALKLQIEDNVRVINEAWAKAAQNNAEAESTRILGEDVRLENEARKQQIANYESEMKALREIVAMFVPARNGESAPGESGIEKVKLLAKEGLPPLEEARQLAIAPIVASATGSGSDPVNPFLATETEVSSATAESDRLDQGASNVLSLAEKVRSLQKGMKR